MRCTILAEVQMQLPGSCLLFDCELRDAFKVLAVVADGVGWKN